MEQEPVLPPPPVNNLPIKRAIDLLSPQEQADLKADLEAIHNQRILAAGSAVLFYF